MITNLLQQIRDLLQGIHDYMSSIKDSVDHMADLLEALAQVIADIDAAINAIKRDVSQIADDTAAISDDTIVIKNNTTDLKNDIAIMKANDIDHYLAEETALGSINLLLQTLATVTTLIKDKTVLIQSDVSGIKHDTGIILNSNASIATSAGQSAALLNDIASNTLNTDNRVALISADTTEIIAVLRQIRDTIQNHWNPTP